MIYLCYSPSGGKGRQRLGTREFQVYLLVMTHLKNITHIYPNRSTFSKMRDFLVTTLKKHLKSWILEVFCLLPLEIAIMINSFPI